MLWTINYFINNFIYYYYFLFINNEIGWISWSLEEEKEEEEISIMEIWIIYFVVEFLKNRENWTFHDETFSLTFWYQRFFAIEKKFNKNIIYLSLNSL